VSGDDASRIDIKGEPDPALFGLLLDEGAKLITLEDQGFFLESSRGGLEIEVEIEARCCLYLR